MLNQVVIVGRAKEFKEEEKVTILTLEVRRAYKNENGEYEVDYLPCKLFNGIADTFKDYCKINDLVGVKGRIQTTRIDDKDIIEIIAERITFISHKKEEE